MGPDGRAVPTQRVEIPGSCARAASHDDGCYLAAVTPILTASALAAQTRLLGFQNRNSDRGQKKKQMRPGRSRISFPLVYLAGGAAWVLGCDYVLGTHAGLSLRLSLLLACGAL